MRFFTAGHAEGSVSFENHVASLEKLKKWKPGHLALLKATVTVALQSSIQLLVKQLFDGTAAVCFSTITQLTPTTTTLPQISLSFLYFSIDLSRFFLLSVLLLSSLIFSSLTLLSCPLSSYPLLPKFYTDTGSGLRGDLRR